MNRLKKGGLAAAVAVALVACSASVATAATLSTSGPSSPYTGTLQARSSTNATFQFSTGTITCASTASTNYAFIGNGSISSASITSTYPGTAQGTLTSSYFGKALALGASAPTACDTSTIAAISSCTARTISNIAVKAKTNSGNTGIDATLGPLSVIADCISSSDGSQILGCTYSTGPGSAAAITGASETFAGSPAKAGTLTFTNQPFYKTAGPAACPAANGTTTGKFTGSFKLFAGTASGSAQIYAYQ